MSPVKPINAGWTSAMARTSATRTDGFAATVSLGSWKRVSPYATKRNGVVTSSCKSAVDVCALDFLEQAVSARSAAPTNSTTTICGVSCERIGKALIRNQFLLSHAQHFELSVLCRGEEKPVGLRIQRHGLGPRCSLHRLNHRIFVGTVLVNNGDGAFAIGVKNQSGLLVKGRCVDVVSNRQRGEHLPGVGVYYGHNLAAAAQEEAPVRAIHSHAARRRAWGGGPTLLHFEFAGIDFQQLAFIFQIVVHKTVSIGGGKFGAACQVDRTRDFSCGSINRGCTVACAVEGEDPRRRRIVNDRVGLLSSRHVADRLQRLQVKNCDG